ncbi:MAG: hypothetical protein GXO74_11940 [Calditrichaeota bacterium]|nr:hypothetical protein [Calditrichota bacterium]
MKNCLVHAIASLLTLFLLVTISCIPANYLSPKVLKPGEKTLGLGLSCSNSGEFFEVIPSFCFRAGFFNAMDMGISLTAFPGFGQGVFLDSKLKLAEKPLFISFDSGFLMTTQYFSSDNEEIGLAFHPLFLFGSENIYAGLGWNFNIHREKSYPMGKEPIVKRSRESTPLILLGTSYGKKWKFSIQTIFSPSSKNSLNPSSILQIGFYYCFGLKDNNQKR